MKIAALYDIHGNLPALEAVLEECGRLGVEEIVVGGDVVLGPMSSACLDKLSSLQLPVHFILGNCEVAVLDVLAGRKTEPLPESVLNNVRWTGKELRPDQIAIIAAWPRELIQEIDALGNVLFCHASPRSITENFTRLTPESRLREIFKTVSEPYVVCGHTHMQFDRRVDNIRVINAGSVGMPFGYPGAYWLLLENGIEFRKTEYDLQQASKMIMDSSYPAAADFAKNNVLYPPSEDLMLEVFEG